jgi:tripartite-type tricarboxylate transporter receptor subunit TctC
MKKFFPVEAAAGRRRILLAGVGGAVAAALSPFSAFGQQAWPSRPIRFVSATAPGGSIDVTARSYGEYITQQTGQPVLLEHRPGGQSMIAAQMVAKSAPDGHTFLFVVNSALTQAPLMLKEVAVPDPAKAFNMLAGFHPGPAVFLISKDLPVKNLREFVERARKQRVTLGSIGAGSRAHMVGAQMNKLLGTQIEIVHYKGAGPALQDLAGGQIDSTIGSYAGSRPLIDGGRIVPIAITSGARTPKLPGVPTFADEGFAQPQFRLRDWLALAAPAGTPRPILQRMAELIKAGTDTPSVMRARDASGVTELPILLDDFEKALAEERPVWQNATRDLNLVLE